MPSLSLRLFPDPVLRKKAKTVKVFDGSLRAEVRILDAIMRQQPHGIGIAAPQVGLSLRLAIVDASARDKSAIRLVLANPVILEAGGEKLSREGCMSLPDYTADLKRSEWVRVRWQDEFGEFHEKTSTGIEAVCIQHEIDHLEGGLFLDRVVCLKTDMFPRGSKGKRRR